MSARDTEHLASPTGANFRSSRLTWLILGIAVLAFSVRLLSVLRGGGLFGLSDYDGAVYYTGADSLISGRVPYRDFLLLHPPGILLVLAPFAALGRIFSDPTGFAVARVAFMLLGALNAALLTKLAGRIGLIAALVAGVFYAVWYPSMYAERTTLLEPVGTTALLVAMLILFKPGRVLSRGASSRGASSRGYVLAGLALGLGATVKIWGVIPLLIVVLWQLRATGWRASARVAAGAGIAIVGVCLPFFVLAPSQMFRMVLADQIGRPVNSGSLLTRLASIGSLEFPLSGSGRYLIAVAVGALSVLVIVVSFFLWRQPWLRIVVVLMFTTGLVLVASPSYYRHYGEFVAAPLALTAAAAAQQLVEWAARRRGSIRAATMMAIAMPLAVWAVFAAMTTFGQYIPWQRSDSAEDVVGCVVSNDPTALIELDVLSSDLRRGCHVWVDVTGLTYDRASLLTRRGSPVSRLKNPVWQRDLYGYLSSGSATILAKTSIGVLSQAGLRELEELPPLAETPAYQIYGRN